MSKKVKKPHPIEVQGAIDETQDLGSFSSNKFSLCSFEGIILVAVLFIEVALLTGIAVSIYTFFANFNPIGSLTGLYLSVFFFYAFNSLLLHLTVDVGKVRRFVFITTNFILGSAIIIVGIIGIRGVITIGFNRDYHTVTMIGSIIFLLFHILVIYKFRKNCRLKDCNVDLENDLDCDFSTFPKKFCCSVHVGLVFLLLLATGLSIYYFILSSGFGHTLSIPQMALPTSLIYLSFFLLYVFSSYLIRIFTTKNTTRRLLFTFLTILVINLSIGSGAYGFIDIIENGISPSSWQIDLLVASLIFIELVLIISIVFKKDCLLKRWKHCFTVPDTVEFNEFCGCLPARLLPKSFSSLLSIPEDDDTRQVHLAVYVLHIGLQLLFLACMIGAAYFLANPIPRLPFYFPLTAFFGCFSIYFLLSNYTIGVLFRDSSARLFVTIIFCNISAHISLGLGIWSTISVINTGFQWSSENSQMMLCSYLFFVILVLGRLLLLLIDKFCCKGDYSIVQ